MARTNTLGNFLTDVANAIRTKKGTNETILASNFDTEIINLPSGGSTQLAPTSITFTNSQETELDLTGLDTSNITDMSTMFAECYNLTNLDLSNFNTSNVVAMNDMFLNMSLCEQLDLSMLDFTSLVSTVNMFYGCSIMTFLDIRTIDLTSLETYDDMFTGLNTSCYIVVADTTQKNWINTNFPDLEEVHTVAEYEGSLNS